MSKDCKYLVWGIVGLFIAAKVWEEFQAAQQAQVLVNQVSGAEATMLGYGAEFAPALQGIL